MAARSLWQRCVRDLTGASRAAAREAGDVVIQLSKLSVWNRFAVSEQLILLSLFSRGEGRRTFCAANGRFCSPARRYNVAACGSSMTGDKYSLEHLNGLNAIPFSTLPLKVQNVTEEFPTGSPTSRETVVVETGASAQEFVAETENTPSTHFMHAIGSEELASAEDSPPSAAELPRCDTGMLSEVIFSPASIQSRLQIDSDRLVQPGRIYVGGLPFFVKGDELKDGLRELCEKYGTVVDVKLAQHQNQSQKSIKAGKHRGFAFVTMENSEQAEEVIDKLNGALAWGRVLMVSYGLMKVETDPSEQIGSKEKSALRCKVFVGNLHEGTSRLDLVNKFQQYGTIVDVKLITELRSNRSRGFGFVTFAEEGQAIKAVLDTDGSILDGSVIKVNIAKYPQEILPQGYV